MYGSPTIKELKKPHSLRQEGSRQRHGEAWRHRMAVPHSHVVDKNQEGYLGSEGSQPENRPPSPGFQHQEDKSP